MGGILRSAVMLRCPVRANDFTCLASLVSATTTRAKVNREAQALDGVLSDRLAQIQRPPRRVIGPGEDVRFQVVDPRVIAETKYPVVHF